MSERIAKTFKLKAIIVKLLKQRAAQERRSMTNYIERLIEQDARANGWQPGQPQQEAP